MPSLAPPVSSLRIPAAPAMLQQPPHDLAGAIGLLYAIGMSAVLWAVPTTLWLVLR